MDSLDSLKNSLESAKNLQGVVSTMKSIAVVNIKKYEKVALNLLKYRSNIDLGLQAILEQVLDEQLPNERTALLAAAKTYLEEETL